MYAAVFEMVSWMGTNVYFYSGKTPDDLIRQFERVQDLDCLVFMGREEEDSKGQKEIDRIEAFMEKHHARTLTINDVKEFAFTLSIGSFRCIDVAEGKEAVDALKAAHPEAR